MKMAGCWLLVLINLTGCFVRPGWTDEEYMVKRLNIDFLKLYLDDGGGDEMKGWSASRAARHLKERGHWVSVSRSDEYLRAGVPVDAQENKLIFRYPPSIRFAVDGNDLYSFFYSVGSNGVDEHGEGDDVVAWTYVSTSANSRAHYAD